MASRQVNVGNELETFSADLTKASADVMEAFRSRPVWALFPGVHAVFDFVTLSPYLIYIPTWLGLCRTRRTQIVILDMYLLMFTLVPPIVLLTDYRGYETFQGVVALARVEEISLVWLAVFVPRWWGRIGVYDVFAYGLQLPFLLAIAIRSFAASGFSDSKGAHPHDPVSLLYTAFSNMTTLGSQFSPVTSGAQFLAMLSALEGLLLFGAVLTTVISLGAGIGKLRE